MPIEFRCTHCDRLLRTPDGTSGKEAKCPQCGAIVQIPDPGQKPSPPPAPELSPHVDSGNPYQSPSAATMAAGPHGEIHRGFHPTRIEMGDMLSRTWQIFKARMWPCVGAIFLVLAVSLILGLIIGIGLQTIVDPRSVTFNLLNNLISNVIGIFINVGIFTYMLKTARGEEASLADLFSGGPLFLSAIGIAILSGLAVIVGLVLFIIPGIIVALMFSQGLLVLVDQHTGVIDSLRYSAQATKGNKLTLFALGLVASTLALVVTVFTCGIGFFFVYPYIMLLLAVTYLAMSGQSTAEQAYPQQGAQ